MNSMISDLIKYLEKDKLELDDALKRILIAYIREEKNAKNLVLQAHINAFLLRLQKTVREGLFSGFKMDPSFPKELVEFFKYATMRELSIMRAPSLLVMECLNEIAAQGRTFRVIFEQMVILEKALLEENVPCRHVLDVRNTILELLVKLYEKFAEAIAEVSSLEALKKMMPNSQTDGFVFKSKDGVKGFYDEFWAQVEFLEEKGFFKKYFSLNNLAEKYKFVKDSCKEIKESGQMTLELKTTLSNLLYKISSRAFSPIEKEQFRLMQGKDATVDQVYGTLDKAKGRFFGDYAGTELYQVLHKKLFQRYDYYKAWEVVYFSENSRASSMKKPLMYQVHCMKYFGDPSLHPREILHDRALRKSLYCYETLPPEEPQNIQKEKNLMKY